MIGRLGAEMCHRAGFANEVADFRVAMAHEFAAAQIDRAEMRSDLKVLKWLHAFTIAGIIALVLKAFFH